jgi:putative nucleotidyltransferase with HDIG domain
MDRGRGAEEGRAMSDSHPGTPSTTPIPVLRALSGLRRSLALYPEGPSVIEAAINELERALESAFRDHDHVRIEIVDGTAHLEGYPYRVDSHANSDALSELGRLDIECFQVERGVERDELARTARLLHQLGDRAPDQTSMRSLLRAAEVDRVVMTKLVPVETRYRSYDWPHSPEHVIEPTYARALDDAQEAINPIFEGHAPEADSLRNLIVWITDQVVDRSSALSQILALKRYENHTYCHSVNVATLALLLGRRLELDDDALAILGEAALLHDVGKRQIPTEILNKPAPLNKREWRIVQRHPVIGADILMRSAGLEALTPTVALEHHRNFAGGGYPELDEQVPHFLSQIVAVVDTYEALTGARPYREPLVPEEACLILARMAGEKLNPALVKAFVSLVTFFPLGSVVRTSDGHVGVVAETSEAEPLHPVIEVVETGSGSPAIRVDTAERDASGQYLRHIVETLPHSVADLDREPLAASA